MTAILIFVVTFVSVFLLGFQSLIVNSGHIGMAMVNSTMIGIAQLFLLTHIPHANSIEEYLGYVLAGPIAVPVAIYVHRRWFKKKEEDEDGE